MRHIIQIGTFAALAVALFCSNTFAQQVALGYGVNNEIVLVENMANQRVDIFATGLGGTGFDTFELFVLIGDGGAAAGGTDTGPGLSDVELGNPGTVFDGGTQGTFPSTSQTPLLWADFIDGIDGSSVSDGNVGTLVFDTTGFSAGTSIDIQFEGINVGGTVFNTNFSNASGSENVASSSNGIIRIVAVPEPSSAIFVLAMTGLVGLRRRR